MAISLYLFNYLITHTSITYNVYVHWSVEEVILGVTSDFGDVT